VLQCPIAGDVSGPLMQQQHTAVSQPTLYLVHASFVALTRFFVLDKWPVMK